MSQKIIIIGAGLSGSLLALRLAQKGFAVEVFEKRPDMRQAAMAAGRSINLALSNRGIRGLHLVGLQQELLQLAIPMHGRMIHVPGQPPVLSPYSGRSGEYINSISRSDLNIALLNKAETYANIKLHFNCNCTGVDLKEAQAHFVNNKGETISEQGAVVIGTDGAGSALRSSMEQDLMGFTLSQQFLEHGYKELNIPAAANGAFQIEKNALHIWPRGSYMLIALPNLTGDFTVTLFLAKQGAENSFEALQQPEKLRHFFETQFPEIPSLVPDLYEQFHANPTGHLGTVKCWPWQAYGKCLLLGDAAHAIVPFYGQGMNCSFEDVVVFDQLVEQHGANWPLVLAAFQQERKENADAIAGLAVDNFYEMRDATANPVFQRKRKLETLLEQNFPQYFSKYSLVTFKDEVSYKQAMLQGRRQDEILMSICAATEDIATLNLETVLQQLDNQSNENHVQS
jgi:kynurenine 3-monooxygenase